MKAAGVQGRPCKTTPSLWDTFDSLTVENGAGAFNGVRLEYYSLHSTYNSCMVTNNGAGTGAGACNAGINTFGNFYQYNTFNDCSVTGNANEQFLINNFSALRLGQDIGNTISGLTYTGSNTSEPAIDINGSDTYATSAYINGPGAQGIHMGTTNSYVNNNNFSAGTASSARTYSDGSTNVGSGNLTNGNVATWQQEPARDPELPKISNTFHWPGGRVQLTPCLSLKACGPRNFMKVAPD